MVLYLSQDKWCDGYPITSRTFPVACPDHGMTTRSLVPFIGLSSVCLLVVTLPSIIRWRPPVSCRSRGHGSLPERRWGTWPRSIAGHVASGIQRQSCGRGRVFPLSLAIHGLGSSRMTFIILPPVSQAFFASLAGSMLMPPRFGCKMAFKLSKHRHGPWFDTGHGIEPS